MGGLFKLTICSGQQISIYGLVIDSADMPVQSATVQLIQNSKILYAVKSDEAGKFLMTTIYQKEITLVTSYLTYENRYKIQIASPKDTFVILKIGGIVKQLQAVVIKSKRPFIERKTDRIVFNVANNITSTGNNAEGVLKKIPMLKVNGDNVEITGKGSVSIMVNNVLSPLHGEDLLNYLRSIPSDDIERVEVITTPPSEYDAQGNNGLINIVLKRNRRLGYNGSVWTGFNQRSYNSQFLGGAFNYRQGKLAVNAILNFYSVAQKETMSTNSIFPNQVWQTLQDRKRQNKGLPYNANFELGYSLSKKVALSFSYNANYSAVTLTPQSYTTVYDYRKSVDSILVTTGPEKRSARTQFVDIFIQTAFDSSGKKLLINLDGIFNSSENHRTWENSSYDGNMNVIANSESRFNTAGNRNPKNYSIRIDLSLPYRFAMIQLGSKLSFSKSVSAATQYQDRANTWILDTNNNSVFKYKENIQSLYFNVKKDAGKLSAQLGIRAEYAQINGNAILINQVNSDRYLKIFPSLFFLYQLDDKNSIGLNYGRRINRPDYWNLSPYKTYTNPYLYGTGNPFLQPEFTHNVELSHTYDGKLFNSFSFSLAQNGFERVLFNNDDHVQVQYPLNFKTTYRYNFTSSCTLDHFAWLSSNINTAVYYAKTLSSIPQTLPKVNGWGAEFSVYNQVYLNKAKTIIASTDFWYTSPQVSGIYNVSRIYQLDLGFQVYLLQKKVQVSLNADDVFRSGLYRSSSLVNDVKSATCNYNDDRRLGLTIKYSFGNNTIKSQTRSSSNDDEKRRIESGQ